MSKRKFKLLFLFVCTSSIFSTASGQDLKVGDNQADYVIITSPSYRSLVEPLASFHTQKDGFKVLVVTMDSIMAQFGASSSPDTALRAFIQFALNSWHDPKPQYFLLAGNLNAVPSHPGPETIVAPGYPIVDSVLMRDQWFLENPDSGNKIIGNVSLGRLPAGDSTEMSVMINKTISYGADTSSSWRNTAISLAEYNADDGDVFEILSENLVGLVGQLWKDTISVYVRGDSPYHLDSAGFVKLWNKGAAVVSYIGMVGPYHLSLSNYFTLSSVDSLINGERLPLCLMGESDFALDTDSAETIPIRLLGHPGGGAISVISWEGLIYSDVLADFYASLIRSLTANPDLSIGKAFENQAVGGIIDDKFNYLGDPALQVVHPDIKTSVPPPTTPASFLLEQNYPNPFNPSTTITFDLKQASRVTMDIYNTLGQRVLSDDYGTMNAGRYNEVVSMDRFASGVYFYRIAAIGNDGQRFVSIRKLVLMK